MAIRAETQSMESYPRLASGQCGGPQIFDMAGWPEHRSRVQHVAPNGLRECRGVVVLARRPRMEPGVVRAYVAGRVAMRSLRLEGNELILEWSERGGTELP